MFTKLSFSKIEPGNEEEKKPSCLSKRAQNCFKEDEASDICVHSNLIFSKATLFLLHPSSCS